MPDKKPKKKVDPHKAWFMALSDEKFLVLCRQWNEKHLDLTIPTEGNYDDYLEYFKTVTPNKLKNLFKFGKDAIYVEAYAAVSRWVEIMGSPSKIEKIRRTKMAEDQEQNINDIAVGDDDEAFYEALIQQNVRQLNSTSVSQQEVARLTSNINIFRKELRTIRSRTIRKDTVLARIMESANGVQPKPTAKNKAAPKRKPTVKKKTNAKKAKTRQTDAKN